MSVILRNFRIPITATQMATIRKEWSTFGKPGCAMIAQPVVGFGSFLTDKPCLDIAIVTPELGEALNATVQSHRKSTKKRK